MNTCSYKLTTNTMETERCAESFLKSDYILYFIVVTFLVLPLNNLCISA